MAYLMMKMIGMLLQAQERGTGVEKMLGLGHTVHNRLCKFRAAETTHAR